MRLIPYSYLCLSTPICKVTRWLLGAPLTLIFALPETMVGELHMTEWIQGLKTGLLKCKASHIHSLEWGRCYSVSLLNLGLKKLCTFPLILGPLPFLWKQIQKSLLAPQEGWDPETTIASAKLIQPSPVQLEKKTPAKHRCLTQCSQCQSSSTKMSQVPTTPAHKQ